MSHSSVTPPTVHPREARPESVIAADEEVQGLLKALGDPECRAILAATSDEALSAREVAASLDLPLSTTYRKLELLTDAGLLVERTRVRRVGKHPSEYVRSFGDVLVSVTPEDGAEIRVTRPGPADGPQYTRL